MSVIPGQDIPSTSIVDTVEALRYLRTDPTDNKLYKDQINYDRDSIKYYAQLQAKVAKDDTNNFKLTKAQRAVLNYLVAKEPDLQISNKLGLIDNKQDAKFAQSLFKAAADELKQDRDLGLNIIQGFKKLGQIIGQLR